MGKACEQPSVSELRRTAAIEKIEDRAAVGR